MQQDPQDEAKKEALKFLLNTPKAIIFTISSLLSGHLWVFIITTYLKRSQKGNKYLEKYYSKIAIGGLWFLVINTPFYYIKYNQISFDFIKFLDVFCNYFLITSFIQLLTIILIPALVKERKNVRA